MSTSRFLLKCGSFVLVLVGALGNIAWGQAPAQQPAPPGPPRPGSVNYIEGLASIGTMSLNPGMTGAVVETGQTLTTQDGKVEILLTPGVFLRVGPNSAVKMVSPDLTNTRVQLDKGRAFVEAIDVRGQNDIRVDMNGASTKLEKQGLYEFDADHATVRVFKGKAEVMAANQTVGLGEHHDVVLTAGVKPKSQSFDEKKFEDDFYRWNSLRSGYLSEASVSTARGYMREGGAYGPGWNGFGWYWDPWFGVYTFLPGDGIFYGGFGWGFYSPFAVYRSPFFYHPGIAHPFGAYHYPYGHGFAAPRGFGGGMRGGGRR
jgi:hypothetical protein